MPIALSPEETWEYQLVSDRRTTADGKLETDPDGTFFLCGYLTPRDVADIQDRVAKYELGALNGTQVMELNVGTRVLIVCERGLRGWRNFRDKDGNDVPFPTRRISGREVCDVQKALAYLSTQHRAELAQAIDARQEASTSDSD